MSIGKRAQEKTDDRWEKSTGRPDMDPAAEVTLLPRQGFSEAQKTYVRLTFDANRDHSGPPQKGVRTFAQFEIPSWT